jgi:hypothetical protein
MTPNPIDCVDFSKVYIMVTDYVEEIKKDGWQEDSDIDHYIFEAVMEAIYGKDCWIKFNEMVE